MTEPASQTDRDPLSTDDGLVAAAAAGMPEVESRDTPPGEDAQPTEKRPLLDHPELDVDDGGVDPCAEPGQGNASSFGSYVSADGGHATDGG